MNDSVGLLSGTYKEWTHAGKNCVERKLAHTRHSLGPSRGTGWRMETQVYAAEGGPGFFGIPHLTSDGARTMLRKEPCGEFKVNQESRTVFCTNGRALAVAERRGEGVGVYAAG